MSEELKPCPFCGPGQSIVSLYEYRDGVWIIGCGRCGSHSGINHDQSKVVAGWNTRQEPKTLTVEEIETFLINMKPSRLTAMVKKAKDAK